MDAKQPTGFHFSRRMTTLFARLEPARVLRLGSLTRIGIQIRDKKYPKFETPNFMGLEMP